MANKSKFYQVTKEIKGIKYTAQFNGMSAALKAVDSSNMNVDGATTTSIEKMAKYIFENVIIEPKGLTADDFEDMEEFNEVVTFGREVMQGNFRNKKDENTTEKGSKE